MILSRWLDRRPRVAVVRLSGLIAPQRPDSVVPTLSAAGLAPLLARAFALPRLAGVMLSINSPGGSAVQSSLIGARIRALADKKGVPVVACVEDAAASGGYWIACAADEIVADPASIVGSIGVISAGFGFQQAIGRLGIERRLHTAGTEKSLLDPFRPETAEDVARLDAVLADLHGAFIAWIKARRADRLKADDATLFTGRFWTGRQGLELGLVDRLGTLEAEAKRRFGEEVRLVTLGVRRRPGLLQRLFPLAELPALALAAAEERAAWARIGL
jgi:serine protease SohB